MAQVLVVESDGGMRATIGSALTQAGYAVVEADTGIAALALMAASERPLVVALDLDLSDLDGSHVIRFVGNALPLGWISAMVLMSSDSGGPRLLDGHAHGRRDGRAKQAPQVLFKPFDRDTLVGAVRLAESRLIGGSRRRVARFDAVPFDVVQVEARG